MSRKKIIINADDFGLSQSANQAVVDLFLKGKISSATVMTNLGATSQQALSLAKKYQLPIGLHFNLTVGKPLTENLKTLTDSQGSFFPRKKFERHLAKISRKEIQQELFSQYELIISQGITPTHLDSHQHIHNLPRIYPVVADFAASKKIALRKVKELIIWRSFFLKPKDILQVIRKTISYSFNVYNEKIFAKKIKKNHDLFSFFALCPRPKSIQMEHYLKILQKMNNYSELMVHPITEEQGTATSITHYSTQEYQILKDFDFSNYQLINYSQL